MKISEYKVNKNIYYKVKSSDTLESIAERFCVSKLSLQKMINRNTVYEGLILFIPKINKDIYIVKPLDSLETVCKIYNVSKSCLLNENNISEPLFVGQKLYIPFE